MGGPHNQRGSASGAIVSDGSYSWRRRSRFLWLVGEAHLMSQRYSYPNRAFRINGLRFFARLCVLHNRDAHSKRHQIEGN